MKPAPPNTPVTPRELRLTAAREAAWRDVIAWTRYSEALAYSFTAGFGLGLEGVAGITMRPIDAIQQEGRSLLCRYHAARQAVRDHYRFCKEARRIVREIQDRQGTPRGQADAPLGCGPEPEFEFEIEFGPGLGRRRGADSHH